MKYKLITSATLPEKMPVAEKTHTVEKIRITFLSLLVFAAGIPSKQVLDLGGELYVTEILLPLLAAGVIIFGKSQVFREKIFWQFVFAGFCMIFGYMISDMVAGTDSSKYFRAWGRNLILFTDFIALAIIVGSDRRLIWWFVLGIATGALFSLILGSVPIHDWKFGYAKPLALMALLLGYFMPFRITMIFLLLLAIVGIYMDTRAGSAYCLFVAGFLYMRIKKADGLKLSPLMIVKISSVAFLLITMLMVFMSQTQDEFSNRRESSSSGRFAALRVGLVAISDSPILGHGSWGEGTKEYADMVYKDLLPTMKELGRDRQWKRGNTFRPHSQLLQSWIEGGVLAGAFFFFLGYQLFIALKGVILTRQLDYLSPFYVYPL